MHVVKSLMAIFICLCAAGVLAGPVNVNKADAETIAQELQGIGLSKAKAIVAFREENGRFNSLAELAQVKGVGIRTLEINQDNILLDDVRR